MGRRIGFTLICVGSLSLAALAVRRSTAARPVIPEICDLPAHPQAHRGGLRLGQNVAGLRKMRPLISKHVGSNGAAEDQSRATHCSTGQGFQMAEVAVSRQMFQEILSLIGWLRAPPAPA
jgi:hypothetical protein